jgi:hypothetical protein
MCLKAEPQPHFAGRLPVNRVAFTRLPDVCLSPDSGGIADILQPLLGASFGLTHRSKPD